jgi:hypothetical protein
MHATRHRQLHDTWRRVGGQRKRQLRMMVGPDRRGDGRWHGDVVVLAAPWRGQQDVSCRPALPWATGETELLSRPHLGAQARLIARPAASSLAVRMR